MLIEFSCANHKSVKTEVNFSILSSKDSTIEEHHICFAKYVNFITW